jgi:hypothetical protein
VWVRGFGDVISSDLVRDYEIEIKIEYRCRYSG